MITYKTSLTLRDLVRLLLYDEKLSIEESAKKKALKSFLFLKEFSRDKIIYGINTGFGPMAQYRINEKSLKDLQYNLIRSHASGTGEIFPPVYAKAALIIRLVTFLQGKSGVSSEVIEMLLYFINNNITPLIPEHGSVGASGDLVQLSHVGLALIGEGKVYYEGNIYIANELFAQQGIEPLHLKLRDGLAIANGTSMMAGVGVLNLLQARQLFAWTLIASAMVNEIAASYDDFISENLNSTKRHYGQNKVAAELRIILADSKRLKKRENELYRQNNNKGVFSHKVQPYYSLRCVPQVLGPILDTIANAEIIVENEINSVSDNPVVDIDHAMVYHGGNFHGDYVAFEMDKLKIAITKLTMLNERQLNYLLNDKVNDILSPFINMGQLGVQYGLQGLQFTATSTTAENQTLSAPMYIHSIPNNNDNQDIVSMGTNAANLARMVIENSFQVLAIHFIAICQAVDQLKIEHELSSISLTTYCSIRKICPVIIQDRPHSDSIAAIINYLKERSDVL